VSKKGRALTEEEKRLWCRVAARVKARRELPPEEAPRLSTNARLPARTAEPSAAPSRTSATRSVSPPANLAGVRRVRRGQIQIDGALDLHGHTQDAARAAVGRFLQVAHKRGHRAVVVITGVGRGGEGVLKRRFPEWLADPALREIVSGFAPAHRLHGGAGAFYVFIRRRAQPKGT